MLFLFKEMKESVKKEVVPHPPILMHGGGGEGAGGALFTSSIGSRHTLLLEISSRYWGVRLNSFFASHIHEKMWPKSTQF